MFEHLPRVTEESVIAMIEKELPYFKDLLKRCSEGTENPDDALDRMCAELGLAQDNPWLEKTVRACAWSVGKSLEGEVEPAGVEWTAAMYAVASLLATLRLIDRALEAQELEKKLH